MVGVVGSSPIAPTNNSLILFVFLYVCVHCFADRFQAGQYKSREILVRSLPVQRSIQSAGLRELPLAFVMRRVPYCIFLYFSICYIDPGAISE